jgi:hypothetical protein
VTEQLIAIAIIAGIIVGVQRKLEEMKRPKVPLPPPPPGSVPLQVTNLQPPAAQVIVNQQGGHQTSHTFHLLMTIITFGLWAPIWLAVTQATNRARRG